MRFISIKWKIINKGGYMKYITVIHEDIKYYYEPMLTCWYPEPNIEYIYKFKIPDTSIKQHYKKACEMWQSTDTNINDIVIQD